MAIAIKRSGSSSTPPRRNGLASKAKEKPADKWALPTEPSEPESDINRINMLIYGEMGIGKTSLISKMNKPFFLHFEPGGKGLRIHSVEPQSWVDVREYITRILKSDFSTVVFDTADLMYDMAVNYVTEEAGEDYITEGTLGYGKGTDRSMSVMKKEILRVTSSGRNVVFVSHAIEKEFERSTGVKHMKVIPSMKDRPRQFIKGFVDVAGYYGYWGDERYLLIRGNEDVDAKNRLEESFLTPKGLQVHAIPMGESSTEAYENFAAAFNNKQTDQMILRRKAALSERKVRFGKK